MVIWGPVFWHAYVGALREWGIWQVIYIQAQTYAPLPIFESDLIGWQMGITDGEADATQLTCSHLISELIYSTQSFEV